ncbi:MAG: di-heme oxidoredictase family protein [Gemmatimonas sp.]
MPRWYLRVIIAACSVAALASCGDPFLPGAPDASIALDGPIDDLTSSQVAVHAQGDAEFARRFAPTDGLGPLFVATSCESCHVGDGKGHPLFDITRFGRGPASAFDHMRDEGGPQLQNRAILGYLSERVPVGATATARFTAPAVTGLGYLEAVEDATILALADPTDANADGISGRLSLVDSTDFIADIASVSTIAAGAATTRHVPIDGKYVGRFGKKARTINLLHQSVFAYSEDMGITSDLIPRDLYNRQIGAQGGDGVADPELSTSALNAVVFYLRTLRAPPRRDADSPVVREGEQLFVQVGCVKCHVATLRTGRSDVPQLNNIEFAPFTDLLLHDMGSELDDGYTEGDALPSEWRTAPLWGVGLAERAQGGTAHYLHDGRAKSLRDAIGYHGGEGTRSRAAFNALTSTQQERLLAYLRSL